MLKSLAKVIGANQKSSVAAGTVYTITDSSAAVAFGTTSPSITLDQAGTYLIIAAANVLYNAATFVASQSLTLKLRRTNNTAADLGAGLARVLKTSIITALTFSAPPTMMMGLYTTTNTDDVISLFADIAALPGAGSIQVSEANIIAMRLAP